MYIVINWLLNQTCFVLIDILLKYSSNMVLIWKAHDLSTQQIIASRHFIRLIHHLRESWFTLYILGSLPRRPHKFTYNHIHHAYTQIDNCYFWHHFYYHFITKRLNLNFLFNFEESSWLNIKEGFGTRYLFCGFSFCTDCVKDTMLVYSRVYSFIQEYILI